MLRTIVGSALLLIACSPGAATAQTQTGSIAGVIRDEQAALLPGVTVTLTGRMGDTTTVTDAKGEYRFVALDPGDYSLRTDLSGFQPLRRDNISLQLGQQLQVDFALTLAGLSETVVVQAAAPVVDVSSSATANTISQDLLAAAPIARTNAAQLIMNYTPGINSQSAFGGDGNSGNALLLDGVDVRNPGSGTPYTFFDYNLIQEVQVTGMGVQAEMGGFTGAVVNTVTKSGGNRFSGLFEVIGANKGMSSSNVTPEISTANPSLANPPRTLRALNYTTQLGGPIVANKSFFFVNAQRYYLRSKPSDPRTFLNEVSPRQTAKVNAQRGNDNFMFTFQEDDYNILNTTSSLVPINQQTDALAAQLDSPEFLWLGQWRHLFGNRAFAEVKYTGWYGYVDIFPYVNGIPVRLDGKTNAYSGTSGEVVYQTRLRHQVNAALTRYADAFGEHTLKFGAEIERSRARNQYTYAGGGFFYDVGTQPYLMYQYGYDLDPRSHRESLYAQDSWKLTHGLTVNLGARADFLQGVSRSTNDTVYDTKNVAPRLGVAWDVDGRDRSVIKAFYGQYYEGAIANAYSRGVGGINDRVVYNVTGPAPVEVSRRATPVYRIDPNIKQPRVDEFTLAFERALSSTLRVSVTGVWRKWTNALTSVLPDARWAPVSVNNPLTNQPITVFRWANPAQSATNLLIQNTNGFTYLGPDGSVIGTADSERRYRGLVIVLSKRFANRYQFQASYVSSHNEGGIDNTSQSSLRGRLFESATTALVNTYGRPTNFRPHEFKLLGTYVVPIAEVNVSTFYRVTSGTPYTPTLRLSQGLLAVPFTAGRDVFLEARGSRHTPVLSVADVRVEKLFNLGARNRLGAYVDMTNLFNANTVIAVQSRVPSIVVFDAPVSFGNPAGITTSRQLQVGARWSF
jgi:hypothetical protein